MTTKAVSVPPDSFCIQEGQFPDFKSRLSMEPARLMGFLIQPLLSTVVSGRFPINNNPGSGHILSISRRY
ncbi:MAG: hypothetical protein ACP5DX_00895 [Paracoccaceae bacterium]